MSELTEQAQLDILTLLVRLHQIDADRGQDETLVSCPEWYRVIHESIPRIAPLITPKVMMSQIMELKIIVGEI